MKIIFILNPEANGGKNLENEDKIRRWPFPQDVEWEIRKTTRAGEAVEMARAAAEEADVVCSVGGDGTVREVAEGLVLAGKGRLGIVPAGTGNDIVKGLNWSPDLDEAMKRILEGKTKPIDVGYADGQLFINIATVGFDAHVAMETEHFKRRIRSKMAYRLGLLVSFFAYRSLPAVWDDGKETKLFLLAVGNGRFYGGGFEILPQAVFDDGMFDICAVQNIGRLKVLQLFPSILNGTHGKHVKYVTMLRGDSREVDIRSPFILNLDGELIRYNKGKRIKFELRKKAVNLVY